MRRRSAPTVIEADSRTDGSPPPHPAGDEERRGVVTPPYGSTTGGAQRRADVPKAWLPPTKFRAEIWGISHGHRPLHPAGGRGTARRVVVPYGWLRRATAIALGSGAQRSVCAADGRNEEELEQKSPPEGPATPDNPSVSLRLTAPFAQGSLGDGDADLRVGPLGLLAITMVSCHSEERSDVGIRSLLRWTGVRAAGSSAPTESPINHPCQPARSEASAPADGRNGRESAQGPSQKGDRPATAGAALSEAESAEIAAGQIRSLPDK